MRSLCAVNVKINGSFSQVKQCINYYSVLRRNIMCNCDNKKLMQKPTWQNFLTEARVNPGTDARSSICSYNSQYLGEIQIWKLKHCCKTINKCSSVSTVYPKDEMPQFEGKCSVAAKSRPHWFCHTMNWPHIIILSTN